MKAALPILAVTAFFASAPCGAAPASAARHLEYAFAYYDTAATGARAIGSLSGPGSGRLYVDFLRSAPDGGTVVQTREWWWNEIRSDQAVTCEVYPSGNVVCDQYPLIDTVRFVILPMLAPDFFAGVVANPASRVAYSVKLPRNYYSWACVANLKVLGWTGPVGQVDLKGVRRPVNGPKAVEVENATVSYDREKSLPTTVHDVLTPTEDSIEGAESVDLKLSRDQ